MNQLVRFGLAALCLWAAATRVQAQTIPTDITNLQLWLDASDPNGNGSSPTNGAVVSSWKDKSGNNRHTSLFNAGSGYTSPSYYSNQINGKAIIRFTRTSGVIGSAYSAPLDIRAMTSPEITIFTVYKQGTRSGDQAVWGCDNGGWDRFFFSSRATDFDMGSVSFGNVSPFTVNVSGAGQLGQLKCLTAVYSKAGGTDGSAIYFNGQLVTKFTDQTTMGTDALNAIRIGLDGDDNFFNGDMAEMIVYNRKLTLCEITQVNRYLNQKYGVTYSAVSITAGGPTTFLEGRSVTLNSSNTGTSFQWLRNGAAISGATSNSYVATTSGDYSLVVTNGCNDTSAAITVTATIPAPPATALHFDGVNDYIDLGSSVTAQSIKTLECWVKFNSLTGTQEIVNKSRNSNGIELLIYNNNLAFFCMNTSTNVSHIDYPLSNLQTGRWYHLAATWNGSDRTTMRLYVDGVSVGTRIDAGNVGPVGVSDPGAGTKLMVGNWNDDNRYFSGVIDEVRVWDRLRSETEVRTYAYDTLPRNTTGLLAYLRMDQGVAASNNTAVTRVKDYSNNNLTANLMNFTLSGATSNFVESYALVAPMPVAASHINPSGFTANWTAPAVGTVDNYQLDVSTSPNFSSFVAGYNSLNVGNVTNYVVSGLTTGTTYYYRVRANKTTLAGQGANSYASISAVPSTTLPAQWGIFTATAAGTTVNLHWTTQTEINSDYFTVQRSTDGIQYTDLSRHTAAGQSVEKKEYNYTDNQVAEGINYYRIRLTDKDGSQTYSPIRSVNFRNTPEAAVRLYPSPASEYLYIDIQDAALHNSICTIYNLQGQVMMQFKVTRGTEKKNISSLLPGYYVLRFANGHSSKIEKK